MTVSEAIKIIEIGNTLELLRVDTELCADMHRLDLIAEIIGVVTGDMTGAILDPGTDPHFREHLEELFQVAISLSMMARSRAEIARCLKN
jgi:hypothetical protein